MANPTQILISSYTVTTPVNSIAFFSIPGTYTDLLLRISGRMTVNTLDNYNFVINGSTSNMSYKSLYGNGSSASSGNSTTSSSSGINEPSGYTANTFDSNDFYFSNYASSTNKIWSTDGVNEQNALNAYPVLWANVWANTAAITQISVNSASSSNFEIGSTFYLYGIKNS